MINQYRGGVIPQGTDATMAELGRKTIAQVKRQFEDFEFSKGLETLWALLSAADKYIVEQAPWKLARAGEEAQTKLNDTLATSAETLRVACALLSPVLPES